MPSGATTNNAGQRNGRGASGRRIRRSKTAAHTTTNASLLLGRWASGEYWNGLIDEVRIYDRVLSQAEVQADFGGTVTPSNVPPTISLTTPVGGATLRVMHRSLRSLER